MVFLIMFLCEYYLHLTGHKSICLIICSSAAHPVGSSIMLLGGFGFLSRLHGLSIDNLVEVEMVLADGRIVIVNEQEFPGKCSVFSTVFVKPEFSKICGGPSEARAQLSESRLGTKQRHTLFRLSLREISFSKFSPSFFFLCV